MRADGISMLRNSRNNFIFFKGESVYTLQTGSIVSLLINCTDSRGRFFIFSLLHRQPMLFRFICDVRIVCCVCMFSAIITEISLVSAPPTKRQIIRTANCHFRKSHCNEKWLHLKASAYICDICFFFCFLFSTIFLLVISSYESIYDDVRTHSDTYYRILQCIRPASCFLLLWRFI